MKRSFHVITAVLGVAMAAFLFIACGGGGGGDDDVPRSSPAYAGSSMPAFIGTNAYNADFEKLLKDIGQVADLSGEGARRLSTIGSSTMNNDFTEEGSISGTYRNTFSMEYTMSESAFEQFTKIEEIYSSYADSGDQVYPGVLTGEGSFYLENITSGTFDPESRESLTTNHSDHVNYDSYRITVGDHEGYTPFEESKDGYITGQWVEDNVAVTWEEIRTANFSYAYAESGNEPMTVGLLDASLTASYEGTATDVSTYVGSGTICMEGDYEFSFYGCVDFVIDVSYEGDVDEPVDAPDNGTISVSTADARATYAFGTSESNSGCIEYSVIEAGAASAVFTTLVNCL
jgi:hypothetical protein